MRKRSVGAEEGGCVRADWGSGRAGCVHLHPEELRARVICPRVLRLCGWVCEYQRVHRPRRGPGGPTSCFCRQVFQARSPKGGLSGGFCGFLGAPSWV